MGEGGKNKSVQNICQQQYKSQLFFGLQDAIVVVWTAKKQFKKFLWNLCKAFFCFQSSCTSLFSLGQVFGGIWKKNTTNKNHRKIKTYFKVQTHTGGIGWGNVLVGV